MRAPQVTAKRPVAVISVTLLQFLLGLLWLDTTLYLLLISRSARIRQGHDPASIILGLEIAAAVVAPGAVFGLIAAYALAKGKMWGWWLSLMLNAAFALVLIYSMIDEGWRYLDSEMAGVTLLSLLPVILLLLPVLRKFYWHKPATASSERTAS